MPEKVEKCVRSVMDDNPDMGEDRAYAICKSQDLSDGAALADDCPSGQVKINGECVDVESVDAPAPILQGEPRIMASASPLDTQPIEREEMGGDKVKYSGLKLVAEGVWTDSGSETPTLYDERTFENTEPEIPNGHDGPPVNIAHDIHKNGPNAGDPHEASIGGYIDPDSLETDGTALFGDVILNTDESAGAFADDNLKSALENDGTAGFSPSVELMPTELEDADHREAEEYVKAASLTGLGLVRDPASRDVDLARETQNRTVALRASGEDVKTLHRKTTSMSEDTIAEIRAEVMERSLNAEDVQEDAQAIADELGVDVAEVMEVLSPLLDMDDEPEEDEGDAPEMEDDDPEEEEEDEDDEKDMEDVDVEGMQETLAELSERLSDVEDALSDKMGEEDVEQELSALAESDDVEELRDAKDELDKRLSALEDEPADGKTLADSEGSGIDWSEADDSGVDYDPATGSMSSR